MRSDHVLVETVITALRDRGETVSFAESCTGGLLSSLCTVLPGVSDVYMGSVVAYSNAVKTSLLGVPLMQLRSSGAVSLPVARSMARGVRAAIGTTWSLSLTGIAGPGGGSPGKPVGTVCVGIAGPGIDKAIQVHFAGSRQVIQLASAEHALRLLLSELDGSGDVGAEK
jgi:nicotinamide-nucleotide amidase